MAKTDAPAFTLLRRPLPQISFTPNKAQSEVLSACTAPARAPLLVLGAPGTGKTATLIESVVARINSGMDPNQILILTYGRESASALRDAIVLRTSMSSFEPIARTFHSLAFSILNEKADPDDPSYVMVSGAEQDLFIRSLLENPELNPDVVWPQDLALALPTRGFARELRDLILRASERNMTYKELIAKSHELHEKYWEPAAKFWQVYDDVMALRYGTVPGTPLRIDPSAIISGAINKLRGDADLLKKYRSRFSAIYIDEFQESDLSHRALLSLIAGKDLTIFADSDSAIGRFRGADPEGLIVYSDSIGASQIVLSEVERSSAPITELASIVASQFRSTSPSRTRTASARPNLISHRGIDVAKLSSQSDCANYIAHTFRTAHLRDGVPWSEMAVILRSPGAGVSAITRAFALNGIPLDIDAQAMALGENPAIRPLLQIAQIALGEIALTPANWEIIEELLKSEFAGADSLSLRTMRVELAKLRTEGDTRTSTEMMLSAITDPVTEFGDLSITPVLRLNSLIAVAKKALGSSTNVSDLLWAIWTNSKDIDGASIPTMWRNRALAGGVRGASADRDLDAVMQLFESARRFTDRLPFAKPSQFISQVMGESILGDAITSRAARDEVVSVMTVHSAKGSEWQVVAIMGLQEGIWPNLRQRGSLMGSERLVESMRSGLTARDQIEASAASALIEDERRLLHVAITRAKSQLVVTAYREEDSEPSPYFEELHEAVHGTSSEDLAPLVLPRSLTSQALVATLRRTIMDSAVNEAKRGLAASLLQSLNAAGIESANPDNWLGVRPISTTELVIAQDQTVSVSPSNLQSFSECGLKWFIEHSGGRDGDSSAQLIGSAIHALASLILAEPTLSIDDMKSRLADNWKVINANSGWVKDYEFNLAYEKLSKFFTWHAKNNRTLIGVEEKFETMIGRARLNGSVDRIEIDMEGRVFIIDLKTGASDTTREDAQSHRQLQGYQVAVIEGAFENKDLLGITTTSGGAELIYLGGSEKSASVKVQDPIDVGAVKAEIEIAAEAMASNTFIATINDRCRTCGVKALCPLQSEGRAVIDQ